MENQIWTKIKGNETARRIVNHPCRTPYTEAELNSLYRPVWQHKTRAGIALVWLVFITLAHFWVGVGIGMLGESLQRVFGDIPADAEQRKAKKTSYGAQVSAVMVVITLLFVLAQHTLNYVYRVCDCAITRRHLQDDGSVPVLLDAHQLHNGLTMVYGIGWASRTTVAKLQIYLFDP